MTYASKYYALNKAFYYFLILDVVGGSFWERNNKINIKRMPQYLIQKNKAFFNLGSGRG
jgi:hypothetical protein